jgi:hypothetical protein
VIRLGTQAVTRGTMSSPGRWTGPSRNSARRPSSRGCRTTGTMQVTCWLPGTSWHEPYGCAVTVEVILEEGRRIVRRSLTAADGTIIVVEHSFPDAVRHHYNRAGADEDLLLYQGEFFYPEDERGFRGDIRFRWRARPRTSRPGASGRRPRPIWPPCPTCCQVPDIRGCGLRPGRCQSSCLVGPCHPSPRGSLHRKAFLSAHSTRGA